MSNVLLTDDQKVNGANESALVAVMRKIIDRDHLLQNDFEQLWVVGLADDYHIDFIDCVATGAMDILTVEPMRILKAPIERQTRKLIFVRSAAMEKPEVLEHDKLFLEQHRKAAALMKVTILHKLILNETDYTVLH